MFSEYHLEVLEKIIKKAISEEVDLFIFWGDLYKNVVSNFKTKDFVNTKILGFINSLIEAGIEVIMLSGNHDIKIKNIASLDNSLALYTSLNYNDLYVNSQDSNTLSYKDYNIKGEEVRFILLPYLKERDKEEVRSELKSYIDEAKGDSYIVWHIDVFWALYGKVEIQGLNMEASTVWSPEELEALGAKKVFLGHVHNHQRLGTNKSVIYSGSPYKLSFNEEGSDKGYYIHDTLRETSTFHSSEDKKWKTFAYDYAAEGSFLNLIDNIRNEDLEGAVIRIVISNLTTEDYKYIPYKEISDIFQDKKVYLFRGYTYKTLGKVYNDKKDEEYGTEMSLEKLDPEKILKDTLTKDKLDPEYIKKADKCLKDIISNLSEEW